MQCYPQNMEERMEELRKDHPGRRQGMPKGDFVKALGDLAQGLEWLHGHGIMFGDLKPDNILYDAGKDLFVFADFGDSRSLNEHTTGTRCSCPHDVGWGHPQYHCIPDVMSASSDFKSDIWMLAQTAIHLWTGNEPRQNPDRLPSNIPLKRLLQSCYNSKPKDRPSASTFRKAVAEFQKDREAQQETEQDDKIDSPRDDGNRRAAAVRLAMAESEDQGEEYTLYQPEAKTEQPADAGASRNTAASYGVKEAPAPAPPPPSNKSNDWATATDKRGRTYYWNRKTRETRWTNPNHQEAPSADKAAAMEAALNRDAEKISEGFDRKVDMSNLLHR
eukprot:TRINITY_DN1013_c0_g1_i17.p1 TRINITY_DN1013_c0_g1~~TRINITY_DN1013_c0_g1_i17.p1  ORF type:complete len:332 (-),score=67.76 TRINITY_DN1013_c0_g1_i17:427-1422(-)